MMFNNSWFKKEKPLPTMIGLGGGATSLMQNAGGPNISASGGTETTDGNYKIHTFVGSGAFVVSAGTFDVEYLVIGGGGGATKQGGGGGAGGYRTNVPGQTSGGGASAEPTFEVTPGSYTVTIGAGGAHGPPIPGATEGEDSVFGSITSAGGGCGVPGHAPSGPAGNPGPPHAIYNGGSGGGAGYYPGSVLGSGTANQGYSGGSGGNNSPGYGGGGGGGAGGVGSNQGPAPKRLGGPGGAGVSSNIDGSTVTRASGGGGSVSYGNTPHTPATPGGGGHGGGAPGPGSGGEGAANTGGGGGSAGYPSSPGEGGNGGSGLVIVRYDTTQPG